MGLKKILYKTEEILDKLEMGKLDKFVIYSASPISLGLVILSGLKYLQRDCNSSLYNLNQGFGVATITSLYVGCRVVANKIVKWSKDNIKGKLE